MHFLDHLLGVNGLDGHRDHVKAVGDMAASEHEAVVNVNEDRFAFTIPLSPHP